MGKLIRKATGLTVGMATLLAGLLLPMTASAESASPIDASPIIHYSFDNALTSKTIANEGSAANSDATLSGDATVANGQINLTGSQTISVPTTAIAGKKDVTVSIWLKNNYGNGNTAAALDEMEAVFAAGDCRAKDVRQLTTACADGAVAALAACRYCGA